MQKDQINGLIRHTLTIAGGALVTKGVIDEGVMMECVGIAMSLVGVVWSFIEKKNA
jgi:hypothetical protein